MKNLRINKKELTLTTDQERFGRLWMAADWFLRNENHKTQGPIARKLLKEQLYIGMRYVKYKLQEEKRAKRVEKKCQILNK